MCIGSSEPVLAQCLIAILFICLCIRRPSCRCLYDSVLFLNLVVVTSLIFFVYEGEKLGRKEVEGLGNSAILNGEKRIIGAGGIGMGVRLTQSDEVDQRRNRTMLRQFFEKEQMKRKGMEREKRKHEVNAS